MLDTSTTPVEKGWRSFAWTRERYLHDAHGMDHSSFFSCFWFVETGRCLRLRDEATVYDEIYGRGVSTVSSLDSSLLEVEEFYTVVEFHRSANEAIK